MRYLLLLSSLELGGAERQAINFAEYLRENGYDVQIIGLNHSGKVNEICEKKNIKCCPFFYGNDLYSVALKICYGLKLLNVTEEKKNLLPLVNKLVKYIVKEHFDVCISYCATANTVLGLVKKKLGMHSPVCIWYQRDAGIYDKKFGLQRIAIEYVDCIVANSISGKNWIKEAYSKESELIYNGVKLNPAEHTKREWRDSLGFSEQDIVCTMLANLTDKKNHLFLLEIWKKLLDIGKEYKLLLAGRFDDQYSVLKEFVRDNNMEKNVFFLGQIDDVSGLISATDICVFSALSEGSPNGIIEPAIYGLPVVATDLPEIREIVSEENYSYLFEKNNIEQAINCIVTLAENMDKCKNLGCLNENKVKALFSVERNFSEIIRLAEKTIKQRENK